MDTSLMQQCFQQMRVVLFSSLVALSSHLPAGQLNQPVTDFYGINVSNFGITFLKYEPDSEPLVIERTTLNTPVLFGDPPNIVGNDSPINFMALFLTDSEATALREANEESIKKHGTRLRRQLYISAAGYEAAVKQNLDDWLPNANVTVRQNIIDKLNGSHLNTHFDCKASKGEGGTKRPLAGLYPKQPCVDNFSIVKQLETFGCFEKPNKAEFNICATRWAFKFRTGIEFERHMIVMEQDNVSMSAMANNIALKKNLQSGRHFILQATSLAQPYFNSPDGLIDTPLWMGVFARKGGYYQVGTDYGEDLNSAFIASQAANLDEFMRAPESGLHHTVMSSFEASIKRGDIYIAANRGFDLSGLMKRIKNLYARNNVGDLLFLIADDSEQASLAELTGLSPAHLQQSLIDANVFLNKSRQYGAFSLALFLGLLEPALDQNSYLVVVGEKAEWFANHKGKSIPEVLRDIANDPDQLEELHSKYLQMKNSYLSEKTFKDFEKISGYTRGGPNTLYSGMGKDYVREWLIAMAGKIKNVHFVSKKDYNDELVMAFRNRYSSAKRASAVH